MKTAIIGAGHGCCAVLELLDQRQLDFLDLEVLAVVDVDPAAPGIRFAQEKGWPTFAGIERALAVPGLELVIELTGRDEVLDRIHRLVPPGVRVMDHVMAGVFWDLEEVAGKLRSELAERTELEAKLAADRAQLQILLDCIPEMVVVLDRHLTVKRVNQRFAQAAGRARDTISGKSIRELAASPDGDEWSKELAALCEEVVKTGRPLAVTRCLAIPDEPEHYFQITANPILDDDLEIDRIVATAHETTEQMVLKQETEEAVHRFRQILDAVHGIITIKDLEGRYQLVNPMTEQIVGIPRERMIGRTPAELFPESVAELIHEHDQQALAEGERQVAEEVMQIGGQKRYMLSERFPLTDYQGEVIGVCCVSRDMTRRRELQQDLVRSERLAAIGQLSAGVAHELNSPLSGILAFAEDLLLESEPEDPLRQDYEIIINEAMRCRRIVRDLLEFSRQKAPESQPIAINDVVERVRELVERQATFHDIRFEVDLQEDLPDLPVDPLRVQQAILNLVTNARDALQGEGTITIGTRAVRAERSLEISVSDHGCGIPADQIQDIFTPFVSSKGEQGYGLGLAAVRTIVEQHHGRVEVQSEVGVGSTFRIYFSIPPD